MKIFYTVIWVILGLLSLAAGVAKLMQMPNEIQFFETAGVGISVMLILGAWQVFGALMLPFKKLRPFGALIVAIGFLVSSIIVFMTGQLGFGVFSMLPVLLACFVFYGVKRNLLTNKF